jgi:hypothetical protein
LTQIEGSEFTEDELVDEDSGNDYGISKTRAISLGDKKAALFQMLKSIPFIFPFESRVNCFQHLIDEDSNKISMLWTAPITVRRQYILEDGFSRLSGLSAAQLKQNIRIQFQNSHGQVEEGIGAGVFKEFLTEITKVAFSPAIALFKQTVDNYIYPNPSSGIAHQNHLQLFEFLGKILGKAMYEQILVDVPFAKFFLAKLLGKSNYLYDLPSLDPELYKNLMLLKTFEGNIEDLALNFTIVENEFGEKQERDLIPYGRNITVTNDNKFSYIYHMVYNDIKIVLTVIRLIIASTCKS